MRRFAIIALALLLLVPAIGYASGAQAAEMPTSAVSTSFVAPQLLMASTVVAPPAPARTPRWHRFCDDGVTDIKVHADRVAAALAADPTGKTQVKGCRATPLDFYNAHRENHEDSAPASVADLPRYYREDLELTTLPAGTKYWSACKTATGYIGQCNLRVAGASGEKVWRHKKTHRVVMLGNCANPAGKPEVPEPKVECRSKFVYLKAGYELRAGMLGSTPLIRSACLGIKRPGSQEYDSHLLDECPRTNCDHSEAARSLGLRWLGEYQISLVADEDGWYEFRFDDKQFDGDNVIDDCIIDTNGFQSRGMLTGKTEFYQGVGYLAVMDLKKFPKKGIPETALSFVKPGAYLRPVLMTDTKVERR